MTKDSGYWIKVTTHFQCIECSPIISKLSLASQDHENARISVIYHSDDTASVQEITMDSLRVSAQFPKVLRQPKQPPRVGLNRWVSETMYTMSQAMKCVASPSSGFCKDGTVLPKFHELSGSLGSNAMLSTLHQVLKINQRDFFYDASRLPYTIYRRPDQFTTTKEYITVQINPKLQFKVHGFLSGCQLLSTVADLEEISHRCRNEIMEEIPCQSRFLFRSF